MLISHITSRLNRTPPSVDVPMRVLGSGLVIIAYFIILHINTTLGVVLQMVGDSISIPYFIRTNSWDVVIMVTFLLVISLTHLL
jgi:hypothetical protein